MGRKPGRSWSSDKLRLEIISKRVSGASDAELKQCLEELEAYEHDLFSKPKAQSKYIKFSDLLPEFQQSLHQRFPPEMADQLLFDFIKILSEKYGGYKTSIPQGGSQLWLFLIKSGIELHESVE